MFIFMQKGSPGWGANPGTFGFSLLSHCFTAEQGDQMSL
jgi:hypothetical protein